MKITKGSCEDGKDYLLIYTTEEGGMWRNWGWFESPEAALRIIQAVPENNNSYAILKWECRIDKEK